MNWFERHLNWTAFLGFLSAWPGSFIIGFVVGLFLVIGDPEGKWELPLWAGTLIFIAVPLPMYGWVLRKKHQSLWWLLAAWIPWIGWLMPTLLKNRNTPETRQSYQSLEDCCPKCGLRIAPDWRVCPECGTPLLTKCHKCGLTQRINWRLCPYCGTPRGHDETQHRETKVAPAVREQPRPNQPWTAPSSVGGCCTDLGFITESNPFRIVNPPDAAGVAIEMQPDRTEGHRSDFELDEQR